MTFLEVLLNVLSIIGVVLIGGLIIYFLGSILLKLLNAKEQNEQKAETKPFVEEQKITQQPEEQPVQKLEEQPVATSEPILSYEDTLSDEKFVLDNEKIEDVDYDKASEEKNSLVASSAEETVEEKTTADDVNDIFNDNNDFNFDDFDFDAFFDEQNKTEETKTEEAKIEEDIFGGINENVEEVAPAQTSNASIFDDDFAVSDDDFAVAQHNEQPVAQNNAQPVPQSVVAETFANNSETSSYVSEAVSTTQNTNTTTEKVVYVDNPEKENQLRTELDELRHELAEQKALYDDLKIKSQLSEEKWEVEKTELQQLYVEAEKRELENSEKSLTTLSIEEYQARLDVLRERLKENERELKLNRKEFIPLKRVRKNLDKDKSKLRRREALVAKQKVLLYGVNNIAEIDQEKAKKLAEDLDLLDGLKVSVRHCEEVMEANKDRYPILETANRILTTANEELKADIHECEVAIIKLRRANGEDVDESIFEEVVVQESEVAPKRKRGRPRKTEVAETKQNVETQDVNIEELKRNFDEQDAKILHTAQTESDLPVENNIVVTEEVATPVVSAPTQPLAQNTTTTKTTVTVKKEQVTSTQNTTQVKKEEHKFNFDADEPSYDDLFAIENEDLYDFDDDFDDDDDRK